MVNYGSAKKAGATVAIFVALMVSTAIGLTLVGSPPAEREALEWVRVTTLSSLPADGVPRRFPVSVTTFDAWERLPDHLIPIRRMHPVGYPTAVPLFDWLRPGRGIGSNCPRARREYHGQNPQPVLSPRPPILPTRTVQATG